MDRYDEEELKMRSSMFDLSIPIAMLLNKFAISEWETLQMKYGFSETDYPALKQMIDNMRDTNSFKMLRENPLLKLAMISNPIPEKQKEEDPVEDF